MMGTSSAWRRSGHLTRWWRVGGVLLLMSMLALLPERAQADCSYAGNSGWSPVVFSPPGTITIPANVVAGTVLWTSPATTPSRPPHVKCPHATRNGIYNYLGSQPGGSASTFPISHVPGLGYRIIASDGTPLPAYPSAPPISGNHRLDQPFSLQLIATGPIASGSTVYAGTFGQWKLDGVDTVEDFQTGTAVTFVAPACTVTTNPTSVTLPTVAAAAFGGNGATAGMTPFAIRLQCISGSTLSITLATTSPVAGYPGAIASTTGTGYATGVAVQVLDQQAGNVTFNQPYTVGTTPTGPLSIPYFARYLQTGTVSAGKVNATATFTLTYK